MKSLKKEIGNLEEDITEKVAKVTASDPAIKKDPEVKALLDKVKEEVQMPLEQGEGEKISQPLGE